MLKAKVIPVIVLLFLCRGLAVQAQATVDSVQIKLDNYKKLLDAGAIDQDEYDKMKSQLQNTTQPAGPQTKTAVTQTSDSAKTKLDQLRKLFDTGVINEDEYNRARAKLLGLTLPETKPEIVKPDVVVTKADTMPLKALGDRAKSKVIAGSVILSVGVGFVAGDILYAVLAPKPSSANADTLSSEKVTRRGAEVALGVLGGLASGGGALFLALGLKDRTIYRRRNKAITMNFTGKEIEIALVF